MGLVGADWKEWSGERRERDFGQMERAWSALPYHLPGSYLHHVDKVKKELLGILLPVGGELRVTLANEGLEHPRGNAILNFLGRASTVIQSGLKGPPRGHV